MLDFRVDTFLAVCRYMNFTKASQELNITQPAVSQQIHWLEDSYRTKLFEYKGKKLTLTPAGEVFLSAVTTMKHDDIFLREKIAETCGTAKQLVFGATLSIGEFVMPKRIAAYLERFPDNSVQMIVANTHELLNKINTGELDFALVEGFFAKNEYESQVFSRERFVAVCGRDYSFVKKPRVIEDLLSERLITRELGSGSRDILEKYMETRNLTIRDFPRRVEISNISGIKELTAAGCGITFLYEATVQEELKKGTLVEVPLRDFKITHDFTFLWRRGSIFSSHYHELFELFHASAP